MFTFSLRRTSLAALIPLGLVACTADNPQQPERTPRPALAGALQAAMSEPAAAGPEHRDSLQEVLGRLARNPAAHASALSAARRRVAGSGEAGPMMLEVRTGTRPR